MYELDQCWKAQPWCLARLAIVTNGKNCINPYENGLLLDPAQRSRNNNGFREKSFELGKNLYTLSPAKGLAQLLAITLAELPTGF
ncbi:hypothetical protein llap_9100 [Limosa lapponica baueri]|uniref:Uncharacterized protein n=1 Tax=Limosa lapponica baueri TaxID=1758121 RepID=A0A2I0U3K5_LIMLA|nr:hypothetical protein llap_9100 [Limosa lapponica baueri]